MFKEPAVLLLYKCLRTGWCWWWSCPKGRVYEPQSKLTGKQHAHLNNSNNNNNKAQIGHPEAPNFTLQRYNSHMGEAVDFFTTHYSI